MRILLINKFYNLVGGVERYVLEWEKILIDKGHEVVIFSMNAQKNNESEYSKYFVNNISFTANGGVGSRFKKGVSAIYSVEAKRNLKRLIKDTKPDIAHIHAFCYQLTPSILFPLKEANIPVVLTSHEYKPICPNQRLFNLHSGTICEDCKDKKFYHAVLNRCIKHSLFASLLCSAEAYIYKFLDIYNNYVDFIVTPSSFMRDKFIAGRIKKERIVHIPNFINIEKYTPMPIYKSKKFAYCGRLDGIKGIETLLQAVKLVKHGRLLIIGDGECKDKLKNIKKREAMHNVDFLGYRKSAELIEIMNGCMFTVLSSEGYENCPFAVLESMALGKPVIGSNIGGIPEIIDDGVDGLLFEPRNVDDLVRKIQYMLDNRQVVSDMGKMARRKVEKYYSSDIHYNKIMNVYVQALNNRSTNL